jgi:hypothetical protein
MTRQGSWFRDFWHGVKLAWRSAWTWQRVYRLEAGQGQRWVVRRGEMRRKYDGK